MSYFAVSDTGAIFEQDRLHMGKYHGQDRWLQVCGHRSNTSISSKAMREQWFDGPSSSAQKVRNGRNVCDLTEPVTWIPPCPETKGKQEEWRKAIKLFYCKLYWQNKKHKILTRQEIIDLGAPDDSTLETPGKPSKKRKLGEIGGGNNSETQKPEVKGSIFDVGSASGVENAELQENAEFQEKTEIPESMEVQEDAEAQENAEVLENTEGLEDEKEEKNEGNIEEKENDEENSSKRRKLNVENASSDKEPEGEFDSDDIKKKIRCPGS